MAVLEVVLLGGGGRGKLLTWEKGFLWQIRGGTG